jgi:formylglycine-generating enzyme required for sulfatase activity
MSCGGNQVGNSESVTSESSVQTQKNNTQRSQPTPIAKPVVEQQRIAVLELKNNSKGLVKNEEVSYLSNLVRQASGRLPQDRFLIMTQENILSLLPEGKSLEDCQKDCAISTGRELGANYIITGEVVKFGDSIRIALTLHESKSGALKASDNIAGQKVEELEGKVQGATVGLFGEMVPEMKRSAERLKKGFVYEKISLNDLVVSQISQNKKLSEIKVEQVNVPMINQVEVKGINFGAVNVEVLVLYDQAVKAEKNSQLQAKEKKAAWDLLLAKDQDSEIGKLALSRSQAWTNMIANEEYQSVVNFDQGKATPQEKIARWQDLKNRLPSYATQASQRILEWENWLQEDARKKANLEKLYQGMIELDQKRKKKRDDDWQKLSQLLKLEVVSEEDKLNWVEAFVEAYGVHEKLNPYFISIEGKYLRHLKARIEEIRAENLVELKQKADLLTSLPDVFWNGKSLDIWNEIPSEFSRGFEMKISGVEMILIQGGSFMMGSASGESDEMPMHRVEVRDFYMSKTEVTVGQYRKCVDEGVCSEPDDKNDGSYCNWGYSDRDDHPINCVDWKQARAFAKWVGGDLPSEAQWEYASRSRGRDIKYPWGNAEVTCEYASSIGCGKLGTWEVCSKTGGNTTQGLCDMGGNVWEWVLDEYHDSYSGAPSDDIGWCSDRGCDGDTSAHRVNRGGSWYADASYLRSAYRGHTSPDNRNDSLGFRVSELVP